MKKYLEGKKEKNDIKKYNGFIYMWYAYIKNKILVSLLIKRFIIIFRDNLSEHRISFVVSRFMILFGDSLWIKYVKLR